MNRQQGLTLIELLVVVAILAALSGSAALFVDGLDSRDRHHETVERLAALRSAVLGPDVLSPTGDLLSGGYLQDMGWPPTTGTDLLQMPAGISGRIFSTRWKTWFGWGGPYLTTLPLRQNEASPNLYDGWGNDFINWPSSPSLFGGSLSIQSTGADGVTGGSGPFDREWPPTGQPLIPESDWVTDLRSWSIRLINRSATDFSASPLTVRLKVVVPRWGTGDPLDVWPATTSERDAWEHYGWRSFSLALPPNAEITETFGPPTQPRRIPNGRRMLFLVSESTGLPVTPNAWRELKLSPRLSPPVETTLEIRP